MSEGHAQTRGPDVGVSVPLVVYKGDMGEAKGGGLWCNDSGTRHMVFTNDLQTCAKV